MMIQLRPETPEDLEFLYQLYASTRAQEMMLTLWTEDQKEAFLRMQFGAQREHYLRYYPNASFQIIQLGSHPIGRLYVDRWEKEIRLMDIALLPEFCGQGLGGKLIRAVQAEGEQTGKAVTVHVEQFNPARRLYLRLGFVLSEDKGVYHLMRWDPPAAACAANGHTDGLTHTG